MVLVGASIQLIGAVSYIKAILRGHTKPNRVSWLIWSVAPLIATLAAIYNGVGWAAVLPVFMSGFGPLMVFVVSLVNKNSYWKLEKTDYLCGCFSILALILWGMTKEPNIAIILAIASDGLAAIPTLVKSWKYPETETIEAYVATLISALTSFFAIEVWNFSSYAFPIYLVSINILFSLFLYKTELKKTINNLLKIGTG